MGAIKEAVGKECLHAKARELSDEEAEKDFEHLDEATDVTDQVEDVVGLAIAHLDIRTRLKVHINKRLFRRQ